MNPLFTFGTDILSWGTLFFQLLIIIGAVILMVALLGSPREKLHRLVHRAADHAFLFGFLISLSALVASLFYSNVIGFDPCELCWWQRIFIYPQIIMFGIALYNERINKVQDTMVFIYSLALSICGAVIALFQYYGQLFSPELLDMCTKTGASCAKIYFVSFGYITIPLMSLTAYIALILIFFFQHTSRKIKSR